MFLGLFDTLRAAKVPVSVRELLDLHAALKAGIVQVDVDAFYTLARTLLVKDERHFDRFDRAFACWFKGMPDLPAKSSAATSETIQHSLYGGLVLPVVALGALSFIAKRNVKPDDDAAASDHKEEQS